MSLALIQESAREARRLAIAGSALAVGDFRLRKCVEPLARAGAKVPVFGQVARAIEALVEGSEGESPGNLLALSTLLNAILLTQGQAGAEGEFRELELVGADCGGTPISSRVLRPIVEALTGAGAGRLEVVKAGWEAGAFRDLRLVEPTLRALGEGYAELADLVEEKILPSFGVGIAPRLRADFDPKGTRREARRLRVMHTLDPEGTVEICKAVLGEGSPEVRAAATRLLGGHGDCRELVLEQARSKNRLVREAALEALAGNADWEVGGVFQELIAAGGLRELIVPSRIMRNPGMLGALLEEGGRLFGRLRRGETEAIAGFASLLECLASQKGEKVEAFLIGCVDQVEVLAKLKAPKDSHETGQTLALQLVRLCEMGTSKAAEAVLRKRESIPPMAFEFVARCALRQWSAARVYEEFSPLLKGKSAVEKAKCEDLEVLMTESEPNLEQDGVPGAPPPPGPGQEAPVEWDPRWLDAALAAKRSRMVLSLAHPGHQGALDYLLAHEELNFADDIVESIRALVRCRHPKLTDHYLSIYTRAGGKGKRPRFGHDYWTEAARFLPPADLPRLEAFAAGLDPAIAPAFLEGLEPLRAALRTNQSPNSHAQG